MKFVACGKKKCSRCPVVEAIPNPGGSQKYRISDDYGNVVVVPLAELTEAFSPRRESDSPDIIVDVPFSDGDKVIMTEEEFNLISDKFV